LFAERDRERAGHAPAAVFGEHVQEAHRAVVVGQGPGDELAAAPDADSGQAANPGSDIAATAAVGPLTDDERSVVGTKRFDPVSGGAEPARVVEYEHEAGVGPDPGAAVGAGPVAADEPVEPERGGAEVQPRAARQGPDEPAGGAGVGCPEIEPAAATDDGAGAVTVVNPDARGGRAGPAEDEVEYRQRRDSGSLKHRPEWFTVDTERHGFKDSAGLTAGKPGLG